MSHAPHFRLAGATVPGGLFRRRDVDCRVKVLAFALAGLCPSGSNLLRLSNESIGDFCGLTPRRVADGLAALEAEGFIERRSTSRSVRVVKVLWLDGGGGDAPPRPARIPARAPAPERG